MQQRYCQCGQDFMVAYVPVGSAGWRFQFLARNRSGILSVRKCPACGQGLDIHSLR